MKKHKLFITILFALLSNLVFAQSSETLRKYITAFKDIAMEEMQRTGVPASITLAQGIHETGAGTSDLVTRSNNHFGIKCKSEWTGEKVYHDDDARGECFRKYDNPFDSYKDHSDFLRNRPYYTSLFELDPTDYKAWAYGLKKAGYATNPKYAQILIHIIETYNLQDYTLIAMGRKKADAENGDIAVWTSSNAVEEKPTEPEIQVAVRKTTVIYPEGKFRINETTVIFVPKGTSYLKLADENNISLSRIFEFNELKPSDVSERDGLVYLQRKRKTGASEYHVVAEGETLYDIAQIEGLRLESLLEYNFLKENLQPATGERLYLQGKAPAVPKLAVSFVFHTVQPKETMFAIARKYSVTVDDVMKWNDMQTIDLKTGQQLRINKKTGDVTN